MAEVFETIDVSLEIDGEAFELRSAWLQEAVSEVGQARCVVADRGTLPEPAELLGKPAVVGVALRNSEARRSFHGLVVEAVRRADADGLPEVALGLAPRLWKLTQRTDCRIFQEMSVPDIVAEVLSGAGVPEDALEWSLAESYAPRTYCCQYRETDFAFVSRLLFEEGIIFAVTHDQGEDKILLSDDDHGMGEITPAVVPFVTLQGFDILKPQVMSLRRDQSVVTDEVSLRDYDFERPKLGLDTALESQDDGPHALEVYDYPGRFVDQGVGDRHAKALLHSMQAERDVLSGETTLLSIKPGHRFTVELHPHDELNQEWMVVAVDSECRATASFHANEDTRDYACRFRAIPTETSIYKAPRRSVTSVVPGTQTAFVTGPSGSEIHPDEHGRVKVRFLWDRNDPSDDTSSCWLRTEQPNTPDSMLLPRVGWEVSVRYLEGDVDRPMCFGRLYNALAPPPYKLPDHKARSALQTNTSPGDGTSNELRYDDSGGSEEMFVDASKDLSIEVGNNMSMTIGNQEVRSIGSNHSFAVTNTYEANIGGHQKLCVDGKQTWNVETYMLDDVDGDHELTIAGNRDMQIGGDHKHGVGGSQTEDVSGMDVDLVVGKVEEKVDGDYNHEVGGALVELVTANRDFTVAGSRTENVSAVKVVVSHGGRGVDVGGMLNTQVAGAIVNKVTGDKNTKSPSMYSDIVAGAQIVKANNVTYEGQSLVALVMGASTLIVSEAAVLLMGLSVKWDGKTNDTGVLIVDN